MIKSALSEYRETSSRVESSSVNGKEDKAEVHTDAHKKNGKGSKFTVADTNKTRPVALIEKIACSGDLRMFCHVDATDWCPNGDIIEKLAKFFTKNVCVEIYPRSLVSVVWEKDHPCQTYDKEYYAFRAYAGPDYCKIFVDETETRDSVLWVMLHELAHIALASAPYLFRAFRHLTPANYFESDEAHESDPEEQMANSMAMSWMDMLGYGKVSYPRHWWRKRTMLNKQANRFENFIDTLRGKNVDKAREALSGASQDMYDRLNRLKGMQSTYDKSMTDLWGDGGISGRMNDTIESLGLSPFDRNVTEAILADPDNYSPELVSDIKNYNKIYDRKETASNNLLYNRDKIIDLPSNISALQDDLVTAQKATDIARLQTAAGLGTVGTAGAYGLGRKSSNKETNNRSKTMLNKQAAFYTKYVDQAKDLAAEHADELRSAGVGATLLGTGAGIRGAAQAYKKGKDEDIQAMLDGKELTPAQRKSRRRKRMAGVLAQGTAGAATGGILGGLGHKAKRILPDMVQSSVGELNTGVRDALGELNTGVADLKGEVDDFGVSDLLFKRDSRMGRLLNSRLFRRNADDAKAMADARRQRRAAAAAEDLDGGYDVFGVADDLDKTANAPGTTKLASVTTAYPYLRRYHSHIKGN